MKLEGWDDLRGVEKGLDETLRDVFRGKTLTLWPPRLVTQVAPSSDVFLRGDDLVVRVELPGIDPDTDVAITVEDGQLVVKRRRTTTQEVADQDYYRRGVWYGSFERRLPLPDDITEDEVEATYDRGMLEVTVHGAAAPVEGPKSSPRTIPVRT